MTLPELQTGIDCPSSEIAAYIDGELSPLEQAGLDEHLAACSDCRTELNYQKSFLFALNSSLENEKEFELPKNFTKTIIANAESSVSGLRGSNERFTALFICAALLLFALFALGSDAELMFRASGKAVEGLLALGLFALHFVYDISLSGAVIARSLFSQPVIGLTLLTACVAALIAGGMFIYWRSPIRETNSTK